jgi:predicted nucleic acid-binding protein
VTAEDIYVDPSALCRLYLNQPGLREMSDWRRRVGGSLPVTHHGRTEIVNGICRAAFSGQLDEDQTSEALAEVEEDFASGRLHQADILWRAALNRAVDLSCEHTPKLGTRASDVLHVACALELKSRHFLTFDDRQRKLASAAGLKLIKL